MSSFRILRKARSIVYIDRIQVYESSPMLMKCMRKMRIGFSSTKNGRMNISIGSIWNDISSVEYFMKYLCESCISLTEIEFSVNILDKSSIWVEKCIFPSLHDNTMYMHNDAVRLKNKISDSYIMIPGFNVAYSGPRGDDVVMAIYGDRPPKPLKEYKNKSLKFEIRVKTSRRKDLAHPKSVIETFHLDCDSPVFTRESLIKEFKRYCYIDDAVLRCMQRPYIPEPFILTS